MERNGTKKGIDPSCGIVFGCIVGLCVLGLSIIIINFVIGNNIKLTPKDVVGTYVHQYETPHPGVETFVLRADGTYTQTFVFLHDGVLHRVGKWTLLNYPDHEVDLENAVVNAAVVHTSNEKDSFYGLPINTFMGKVIGLEGWEGENYHKVR